MENGQIASKYVPTKLMVADLLTKALLVSQVRQLRDLMGYCRFRGSLLERCATLGGSVHFSFVCDAMTSLLYTWSPIHSKDSLYYFPLFSIPCFLPVAV